MARAADNSQFDLNGPPVTAFESVWPSTRRIQGMSGGISRSRSSSAEASESSDCWPAGLMSALADFEQHRGFEHEPIADDADVGTRTEDLAQPTKEIGAVAGELLHLLRERDIQPLAEVGDLGLRLAAGGLGSRERLLDRRELFAQRGDLLVEDVDLGERLGGNLALRRRARWRPQSPGRAPPRLPRRPAWRRRADACARDWRASSVAVSAAILVWSSPFCDRSSASRLVSSSIC